MDNQDSLPPLQDLNNGLDSHAGNNSQANGNDLIPQNNDFTINQAMIDASREPDVAAEPASDQINALVDAEPLEDQRKSKPRAFVVMPFGTKNNAKGEPVDFDAIYRLLIDPALEQAGFDAIRADEEMMSGDILTDMFQELLLADLVVADVSIDNANVFYELGVRHAFRKRGIVHIQCGRNYLPFDVFNVRTIPYRAGSDGLDIEKSPHLETDLENIVSACRSTWASNVDSVHSPIFNLLTGLTEPDRRALTTPLATGFWREYTDWNEKIAIAERQKRIGDIMLLTEEIDNPLIKEEAIHAAGEVLRTMGRPELALNEYRKGLKLNPRNLQFRQEEALLLNDIGRVDAAIVKLERLSAEEPLDSRNTRYLGRIYVKLWRDYWCEGFDLNERRKRAYDTYQWLLKSIDTYLKGFRVNLNNFEMGIKALLLCDILRDLYHEYASSDTPQDADVLRIEDLYDDLASTLRFRLSTLSEDQRDVYWALVAKAELLFVQSGSEVVVLRAYNKALSFARRNVGYLKASLRQLELCVDIGYKTELASKGCDLLRDEIRRIEKPEKIKKTLELPNTDSQVQAFVFAGHGLDELDAKTARFPAKNEGVVLYNIERALDDRCADDNDHAFLSGVRPGGEILFVEACLKRDMRVHIHLPTKESDYLQENFKARESWLDRYYSIRTHPNVKFYYQRERVGDAVRPEGLSKYIASSKRPDEDERKMHTAAAYRRNIRWTLYCSMQLGIEKLRLIALWDGKSDTPKDDLDGSRVSEMVSMTRQFGGRFDHLDITKFELLLDEDNPAELVDESRFKISARRRVEILKNTSLFKDFNSVDLNQIALVLVEHTFSGNDFLVEQDDPGDSLYFIASGETSIIVNGQEVARRSSGEFVGEMALFPNQHRIATVKAVGSVLTLALGQKEFTRILNERPEAKLAVLRVLATRLEEAVEKIAELKK